MKQKILPQVLTLVLRLITGFVFIYAAIGKIAEPQAFAKEILNYKIVGGEFARAISIFLPWVEVIVGIFLIFGIRSQTSALISTILLLLFTFAVLSAIIRGLNINCGCFAYHVQYVEWKKIIENLLLILSSIYVFLYPQGFFSIDIFDKFATK